MPIFENEGFQLNYLDEGEGAPVLLIHGFASNLRVNWVEPGWVKTLTDAGYRVLAFDHRGHGRSSVSYEQRDYHPSRMAADAAALLAHAGVGRAHVFGYSMGARTAAFMALEHRAKVATLVLGGLGIGLVAGVGDWQPIIDGLLAEDSATVTQPQARMFRSFADRTKSDRHALAACLVSSRVELTEAEVRMIAQPTLVAVGTRDDVGGSPQALADLMPNAVAFEIANRDHMLSVGDRSFKARVLDFLKDHPL